MSPVNSSYKAFRTVIFSDSWNPSNYQLADESDLTTYKSKGLFHWITLPVRIVGRSVIYLTIGLTLGVKDAVIDAKKCFQHLSHCEWEQSLKSIKHLFRSGVIPLSSYCILFYALTFTKKGSEINENIKLLISNPLLNKIGLKVRNFILTRIFKESNDRSLFNIFFLLSTILHTIIACDPRCALLLTEKFPDDSLKNRSIYPVGRHHPISDKTSETTLFFELKRWGVSKKNLSFYEPEIFEELLESKWKKLAKSIQIANNILSDTNQTPFDFFKQTTSDILFHLSLEENSQYLGSDLIRTIKELCKLISVLDASYKITSNVSEAYKPSIARHKWIANQNAGKKTETLQLTNPAANMTVTNKKKNTYARAAMAKALQVLGSSNFLFPSNAIEQANLKNIFFSLKLKERTSIDWALCSLRCVARTMYFIGASCLIAPFGATYHFGKIVWFGTKVTYQKLSHSPQSDRDILRSNVHAFAIDSLHILGVFFALRLSLGTIYNKGLISPDLYFSLPQFLTGPFFKSSLLLHLDAIYTALGGVVYLLFSIVYGASPKIGVKTFFGPEQRRIHLQLSLKNDLGIVGVDGHSLPEIASNNIESWVFSMAIASWTELLAKKNVYAILRRSGNYNTFIRTLREQKLWKEEVEFCKTIDEIYLSLQGQFHINRNIEYVAPHYFDKLLLNLDARKKTQSELKIDANHKAPKKEIDHYSRLITLYNTNSNATINEILNVNTSENDPNREQKLRKAYHGVVMQLHPDKNSGETSKEILLKWMMEKYQEMLGNRVELET